MVSEQCIKCSDEMDNLMWANTYISGDIIRAGLKGRGGPGQISVEGPYDVIHDVIVCKSYVFAD